MLKNHFSKKIPKNKNISKEDNSENNHKLGFLIPVHPAVKKAADIAGLNPLTATVLGLNLFCS